jgi:hypothetical protein
MVMKGIPAAPVTRTRTGSLAIFEEIEGIEQVKIEEWKNSFCLRE